MLHALKALKKKKHKFYKPKTTTTEATTSVTSTTTTTTTSTTTTPSTTAKQLLDYDHESETQPSTLLDNENSYLAEQYLQSPSEFFQEYLIPSQDEAESSGEEDKSVETATGVIDIQEDFTDQPDTVSVVKEIVHKIDFEANEIFNQIFEDLEINI